MQIDFDHKDPLAVKAVLAAVQVLAGDDTGSMFTEEEIQQHEQETGQVAPPPPSTDDSVADDTTSTVGPKDEKGVAFNAEFCGQATDPYYTTGKRAGQWKKRRGVDDSTYDEWYASQLSAAPVEVSEPEPTNTAAAFGAPPPPPADDCPRDTGALMGWVSEKQASGALTLEDVNAAYVEAGIQMGDLFATDPQVAAANVRKVYEILAAKV